MMTNQMQRKITKLLTPVVESMGFAMVGCEYHMSGRFSVLRVYIDREGGINADDCGKVSRQISAILDVEDPISGRYTLEVSSPGLDRPLFTLAQFKQFIGQMVAVRLVEPVEAQRKFTGTLVKVDNQDIILSVEDNEITLSFDNISKANLVYK